jgi:F-type H+-transporting ATPase subunit delta
MSLLAKRYAEALFALANQQGAVDATATELAAVHAALASPGARALLTSPDVKPEERTRVLDKLSQGKGALVRNVFGVLQHRRRLEVLFDLHPAFRDLVMAARGEVDGVAESAHPLAADEVASLEALAGRLSGKKVKLTVAIRPDVLGGVRLRVGNVLYDGSLQSQLGQLAQRLAQASV